MHNAAFAALDLPYSYLPFEVHPEGLERAVKAILPLGLRGLNVTIPHKETVIPFLDSLDEEAGRIGAVNTIEVVSRRLIGRNTDGRGFLQSLREADVDPKGLRVILLGAGGAAKAVASALAMASISEMIIVARSARRATELSHRLTAIASHLKITVQPADFKPDKRFDSKTPTLVINSTPLGMKPSDPLPFPASLIRPEWIVADLIYRPHHTSLLAEAKQIGARVVPGLGMLLHQGALSFEIWTKQSPPILVMRKALQEALSEIILR